MNQFINLILVIFAAQCFAHSSQEQDSSGQSDCDSENEVTNDLNDVESPLEHLDLNSIKRKFNSIKLHEENEEKHTNTSETGKYWKHNSSF